MIGAGFGAQMRASFEHDAANSEQITLENWRKRSIGTRLKEAFARIWQYWL